MDRWYMEARFKSLRSSGGLSLTHNRFPEMQESECSKSAGTGSIWVARLFRSGSPVLVLGETKRKADSRHFGDLVRFPQKKRAHLSHNQNLVLKWSTQN